MRRCHSVAKQYVNLQNGDLLIPGTEVVGGSVFINGPLPIPPVGSPLGDPLPVLDTPHIDANGNTWEYENPPGEWKLESLAGGGMEVYAPFIINEDDMQAVAGSNASVLWPDSGDELFDFDKGETVPVGTGIVKGEVNDGGVTYKNPHTVENENATAKTEVVGSVPLDQQPASGFCNDLGGDIISDELMDILADIAGLDLGDLKRLALSGFIAVIAKLMGKLSQALGKITGEVDKIVDLAKLDPDDICTPPVKKVIAKLLRVMAAYMKMMVVLKKILKIIVLIRKIMKLIKKILKWITIPIPVVAVVEKLIELMNILGIIDVIIGMVLGIVSRFVKIIPMLQAQLLAILAQCAVQVGSEMNSKEACEEAGRCLNEKGNEFEVNPNTKEACELAGGTWDGPEWIDPDKVKDLEKQLKDMADEAAGIFADFDTGEDDGMVSCSLPDGSTQEMSPQECRNAGGTFPGMDDVGYCSIPEHTTPEACAAAGGTWNTLNTDTPMDEIDISALEEELAKQINELAKCFQDPELDNYLRGL